MPGITEQPLRHLSSDLMNAISISNASCNQHKSGNPVPYRVMLIERIGIAAVDEIESDHKRHRWTTEECKAIKAEYQQKLKDLRDSRSEAA